MAVIGRGALKNLALRHRERLRARFNKAGLAGFADYEVVELLLTLAIPQGDVKPQAKALIARFKDLRGILDAPREEIESIHGLGGVTATAIRIIREIADLYLQQTAEQRPPLAEPEAIRRFWRAKLGPLNREVFQVAFLDSGLRLLRDGIETLEEGTVDRATVYPRGVVEAALRRGASAVILAHNHPNGDVRPSDQDKTLTRAIVLAASAVQLRVIDHLIISVDEVFSFAQDGLL